jgi:hypothetical protein
MHGAQSGQIHAAPLILAIECLRPAETDAAVVWRAPELSKEGLAAGVTLGVSGAFSDGMPLLTRFPLRSLEQAAKLCGKAFNH